MASSIHDANRHLFTSEFRVTTDNPSHVEKELLDQFLVDTMRDRQLTVIFDQAKSVGMVIDGEVRFEVVIRTTAVGHKK